MIYFLVNLNSTTHDPQFSNAGGYSCTAGRQGRKDVRGGVVQENADALLDRDERDRQKERPKAVASVMNALNVNDVWVT